MKAFVICHSWLPFLPLTYLYEEKKLLWVPVLPSGVFSWEKTPADRRSHLEWESFTELLCNIKKYGKNDIEWQTGI